MRAAVFGTTGAGPRMSLAGPLARPLLLLTALALAGCGTAPPKPEPGAPLKAAPNRAGAASAPALPAAGSGRGAYYKDDGPGDAPPPNLDLVPDAEVRVEPLLPYSNRPYVVFGKTYKPITDDQPFVQRGVGSWYGKKFHGQRTSSGEIYDMYKMTAAHPTLPIPSYARLTSIATGKQVIVRINDRGPFHATRVIDVSYTAALKLGFLGAGSHELRVERLLPAEIEKILAARQQAKAAAAPASPLFAVPLMAPTTAQIEALMVSEHLPPTVPLTVPLPAPVVTPLPAADAAGGGTLAPAGADGNVYYLQLGAFAQADNAEQERVKLSPYAATLGALEVVQNGPVYRLLGGPYPNRVAAGRVAQALPDELNLKPIPVQRPAAREVADALTGKPGTGDPENRP
ncbi:MAG: septal ring lytic transglycosylase RlpA family protein [Pseudomonadota bacterium]